MTLLRGDFSLISDEVNFLDLIFFLFILRSLSVILLSPPPPLPPQLQLLLGSVRLGEGAADRVHHVQTQPAAR